MEKSIRIDPVPQPPSPASQSMIAAELGLTGSEPTAVFQGFVAVKRPPIVPPEDVLMEEVLDDEVLDAPPLPLEVEVEVEVEDVDVLVDEELLVVP
jgi:hypothetical protein